MDQFLELLKVYKDYGVSGLFLVLLLIVVYYFYQELKDREAKSVAMTERVIQALDQNSENKERTIEALKNVSLSLDTNTKETSAFVSYIKGRDGRTS